MSLVLLPSDLQPIVLSYLCPLETPYAIQIFNATKHSNSLEKWTKSIEIITREEATCIFWISQVTRVNGKIHSSSSNKNNAAIVDFDGTKHWYKNNNRHRDNDKPAYEDADPNGTKKWYVENKLHRDNDKPAIECASGTKHWYINGKLHRVIDDKPAIEDADGNKHWYMNGKLHRAAGNDKPASEYADGYKEWYIHGELQRNNYRDNYL